MKFFLVLFLAFSFIGISESFAQEFDFEIWPTESVVRYPDFPTIEFTLTPAPTGPFESFYLEDMDELVPENNILVIYKIATPDGLTETSIGHFHLDDITQYSTKVSIGTPVAGEYSITGKIFWQTDGKLFSLSSNTVTITAKDPIFRGMVTEIPDQKLEGVQPLDWSPDGNLILFKYVENFGADNWQEKLATVTPDGKDLTTLPISNLTDENQFYDALFSPDGRYIHFSMDDRNLYKFDLSIKEIIQLTHQREIYDFDYYHYNEDNPENYSIVVSVENKDTPNSEDFTLLDIGNGQQENSMINAEALFYDFESPVFDISLDGKKILFKKTNDAGYGWADRVLAYLPAQGNIVEIPTTDANCGSPPRWSPNGEMIIYGNSSCGRGAPGSTINLISIDGKYHEILVPYSNDNSGNFVVSPDGAHIVYGTGDVMKMMTLAKPVPEFETIAMMILIVSVIPAMLLSKIRKLSFLDSKKKDTLACQA